MALTKKKSQKKLPARFSELVAVLPPRAVQDEEHHDEMIEMIDRLTTIGRLTKDQKQYLETLVQLVQAYETTHHQIDVSDISGVDSLRHLLEQNDMNASDLARLLGVHVSLGSKILNEDRSLTVEHLRKLSARFRVSPVLFID
ncbi:helix-turn-helix domain-containing protein [Bythopirellula polymerisocia]|uniref:Antitoxin HigA n=1 Tax=Bythopirellula polymerisocia TaxID=2528003 RepID=A0A5C6D163_9BACT|nr:helix-turn-helix domain-containing protein [Bythopirellula polymerisocia]TWU29397.1 Antitoxin HigA [Bythopirellula polymerisocia]